MKAGDTQILVVFMFRNVKKKKKVHPFSVYFCDLFYGKNKSFL